MWLRSGGAFAHKTQNTRPLTLCLSRPGLHRCPGDYGSTHDLGELLRTHRVSGYKQMLGQMLGHITM